MKLKLGHRTYDLTHRPLVMGILNRTTDSFYDRNAFFGLDDLLRQADCLVRDGADLLDVGARAAGVGTRQVSEAEEVDLVLSSIAQLQCRFDVPLSVDTWRSSVASSAFEAGAVIGNDVSGFSDPEYLPAAASAGATVVATHMRLAPQVADPNPTYRDVVADVRRTLTRLIERAQKAGINCGQLIVDPGLDLGKTWRQSVKLLSALDEFAALGHPLLLAASNKISWAGR
jgi:dihydropteroate synthase